ncbi:dopamine receptor-interacting protein 1-like [Saccoglossus kowalevskii]
MLDRWADECKVPCGKVIPDASNSTDEPIQCSGLRKYRQRRFITSTPPILPLTIDMWSDHLQSVSDLPRTLKLDREMYILHGVTFFKMGHYTSAYRYGRRGWMFYDGLRDQPLSKFQSISPGSKISSLCYLR